MRLIEMEGTDDGCRYLNLNCMKYWQTLLNDGLPTLDWHEIQFKKWLSLVNGVFTFISVEANQKEKEKRSLSQISNGTFETDLRPMSLRRTSQTAIVETQKSKLVKNVEQAPLNATQIQSNQSERDS